MNNGRVDIKLPIPDSNSLFSLYDKIPVNQCTTFQNPLEGLWDDTNVSRAFFSRENIQILQNGIRAGVYQRSNGLYIIDPQPCDVLKVIMRGIYLQYAANQPDHITEQVIQLNQKVLDYSIQQIYGEAQGYLKYLDDASTLVVPIAHPVQASNKERTLELKPWF